ncbi:MAG: sulfatase-like hydrolase/transferase [Planctomycetes bacterium]|nr:sulfatase-like hydrolase/transferase [Planctomycetota bacterium]
MNPETATLSQDTATESSRPLSCRAAWIGVASFGISLLTQVENYLFYASRPAGGQAGVAWFLARAPFILFEHAVFATGAALALLLMGRRKSGAVVFWICWTLLQLYVVADQVSYKMLGDHLRRGQVEGRLGGVSGLAREVAGSATAEIEPWMVANALMVIFVAIGLARMDFFARCHPFAWLGGSKRNAAALATAYVALAIPAWTMGERFRLERHPLTAMLISLLPGSPSGVEYSRELAGRLFRPPFGKYEESGVETRALGEARGKIRSQGRRPLVLLYILESVGTSELFGADGSLSPELTPRLAELAKSSVRFDAIYPTFPGTARSHVGIMTGGPTVTWGRYYQQMESRYTGPNLVSEMRRLGYRTGVFSAGDLVFENLGSFYKGLGPDRVAYYNDGWSGMDPETKINSWGVSSDEAVKAACRWIDETPGGKEPLFMVFLTLETHHPYDCPSSFKGPFDATDRQGRFRNALFYTDAVLGRLGQELERRGLWDDALVLVTGDHGEAFGTVHRGNFGHRNYLYEENLRTFLLVADRKNLNSELVSHRPASNTDLGATLLGLLGADPGAMPGQDLLSPDYRLQTIFFHKQSPPYRWGLRDGRFKFVSDMEGARRELFDLQADPGEQANLAEAHPDQAALYQDLCATWYVKTGYDFIDRLQGFILEPDERVYADLLRKHRPPGIDRVVLGTNTGPENSFADTSSFSPTDEIQLQIDWRPWDRDQQIAYTIKGPDGFVKRSEFALRASTLHTSMPLGITTPMPVGEYRVQLWLTREKLGNARFTVR